MFSGEGKTVGEIALIKDDCIRTASVVVDCETDLIVIERNLYNRQVNSDSFCFITYIISLHGRIDKWGGGGARKSGLPLENHKIVSEYDQEISQTADKLMAAQGRATH